MTHFERNFASIFGPESHRRELTPENNHWKRREQRVKAEQAEKNQRESEWERSK